MNNEQALMVVQPEEGGQLLELQFVDGPAPEPEEEISQEHPNFIESNTAAISLEDLATKCIVPTFGDMSLTISHQNFMASVCKAAIEVFGDITPIECRVSHPIIGRVPSALGKKASEVTDDEKTLFYQRLAWISHIKGLSRSVNGQTVFLVCVRVSQIHCLMVVADDVPIQHKGVAGYLYPVCIGQQSHHLLQRTISEITLAIHEIHIGIIVVLLAI